MLGIGFFEMIIIAGIALVVIGPDKFPDFAKIAVRTIRELRGYMDEMKSEIDKELKPVKKELKELKEHSPEKYIDSLSRPVLKTEPPVDRKEEDMTTSGADPGDAEMEGNDPTPNPEPEAGAWQREEYKVAGGNESDEYDIKGPERID